MPDGPASAAEVARLVAKGQDALAASCSTGPFAREHYRIVIAAQSIALDPIPVLAAVVEGAADRVVTSVSTAEKRFAEIVESVQHPALNQKTTEGLMRVMHNLGLEWWRLSGGILRRKSLVAFSLIAAGIATAALILGFIAGWYAVEARADARIATMRAEIRDTGTELPIQDVAALAKLGRNNPNISRIIANAPHFPDKNGQGMTLTVWAIPPRQDPPATH